MKYLDPTITKKIIDAENLNREYRLAKVNGNYETFLRPGREDSLVPVRLLAEIGYSNMKVQNKADALNERENHYRALVRCNPTREYPVWEVCQHCKKFLAFVARGNRRVLCENCKGIRGVDYKKADKRIKKTIKK
jgi:hypothetical protein